MDRLHFTVLDNSRSDDLQPAELAFLEQDLKAHESQPVKFIVSHRPAWLLNVILRSDFQLRELAKKYGVRYVIAGHLHEMLHGNLDGVDYISAPSAGGHLRSSAKYQEGWFFGYLMATVRGTDVSFEVRELPAPNGEGHVTPLTAWGSPDWSHGREVTQAVPAVQTALHVASDASRHHWSFGIHAG